MNREDHNYLKQLEDQLCTMHKTHECPSHELAFDEDDFQRIFGAGDEQQEPPANIYANWDDSGHIRGAFA